VSLASPLQSTSAMNREGLIFAGPRKALHAAKCALKGIGRVNASCFRSVALERGCRAGLIALDAIRHYVQHRMDLGPSVDDGSTTTVETVRDRPSNSD